MKVCYQLGILSISIESKAVLMATADSFGTSCTVKGSGFSYRDPGTNPATRKCQTDGFRAEGLGFKS